MPVPTGVYNRCAICRAFIREGVVCPNCRAGRPATDQQIKRSVRELPLDSLTVPEAYQRRVRDAQVRQIVREFDIYQLGLLTVCKDAEDRHWLLDGQHRWLALVELGFETALCEVLHGLSLARQAEIFSGRNQGRVRVGPLDAFHAEYIAEQPDAVGIVKTLERYGYRIALDSRRPSPDRIACAGTLREVYAWGVLGQTLGVIRASWPGDLMAVQAPVLQGIAAFLKLYPDIAPGDLTRRCAAHTAAEVVKQAQLRQVGTRDRRLWVHVAAVLVELYNRGRREGNRLQWTAVPITAARMWKERRG